MKLTKNNVNDVYRSKEADIDTLKLRGYELVKELFVDSSGFGQESEPALTTSEFDKEVMALVAEHGTLYSFLTGVGMFQCYVGLFKKVGNSSVKKIAHATYRIETPDGYAIRYHATNVVVYSGALCIIRNGGWQSVTTKKRINEHLPNGVYISQKNYVWYVHDTRGVGSVVEFEEGMTIKAV